MPVTRHATSSTLHAVTDDSIALVATLYDAFNARDLERSASAVSDDCVIVNVPLGATLRGPDGIRAFQGGWVTAFSDARVEVRSMTVGVDEHDEQTTRVIVEHVGRGTHDGPLATPAGDIPATGRLVEVPFCEVFELRDGKITSSRTYFDVAMMLRQLGIDPSPANAARGDDPTPVAVARRWFEAMNAGDLDAVVALFADDYRLHYPDVPADARGPEVIRSLVAAYRAAFPDLAFTVDDIVAAGDTVLVRWTAEGTNQGSLMDAAPTGRRARWGGMSLLRIRDGRIVEDWVENDRLGMLQQLGLAPTT
jgi:steroid delta-isomerase-like uncharacterized protein